MRYKTPGTSLGQQLKLSLFYFFFCQRRVGHTGFQRVHSSLRSCFLVIFVDAVSPAPEQCLAYHNTECMFFELSSVFL